MLKMVDFLTHCRADVAEQVTHLVEVPVVRRYRLGHIEHVAGQPIPLRSMHGLARSSVRVPLQRRWSVRRPRRS